MAVDETFLERANRAAEDAGYRALAAVADVARKGPDGEFRLDSPEGRLYRWLHRRVYA